MDLYLECLAKEAENYRAPEVKSIYVGGGTPAYLSSLQLQRLAESIRSNFKFSSGIEWTLEANPEGLDLKKAKLIKELGVNRVSLGIQSLNDRYLKYLGRVHDRRTAVGAFNILREAGFDNINVDLMYAFPQQTQGELKKDLEEVANLNSDHISLYTLTIEKNSRFFVQKVHPKENRDEAKFYLNVLRFIEDRGFKQYEVSSFAKAGKESRHNLNYWHGGNYIGLGMGAHSHLSGKRFWNAARLSLYLARMREGQSPVEGSEELTRDERFKERLLFGLRMNKGVNLTSLESDLGCSLAEEKQTQIADYIKEGFLTQKGEYLKTTLKGRLLLDELSSRLI